MSEPYDVIGIGIGPSNLSLAALLEPRADCRARFFERRPEFQWHPGLLLRGATIQVSFIKDLVTLADPTSRFSFLAFLKDRGRLYRFLNAEFERVDRREFNEYLRWVCDRLDTLEFGREVDSVTLDDEFLVVHVGSERVRTRHLVLGVGTAPVIPECARPHLGRSVFHGSAYLQQRSAIDANRVVVVGAGQTGAEVVERLLGDADQHPSAFWWVSRRDNFLPLDESPFVNELFTPAYTRYFAELPQTMREQIVARQKLASDGISPRTLGRLIQRLYEMEFLDDDYAPCHLWPAHELRGMEARNGGWALEVSDLVGDRVRRLEADVVVLCTGSDPSVPPIASLMDRLSGGSGRLSFRNDYSVRWNRAPMNRVYLQNVDRKIWGIADPNMSLMAWRSALIANSIIGEDVYDTTDTAPLVHWGER